MKSIKLSLLVVAGTVFAACSGSNVTQNPANNAPANTTANTAAPAAPSAPPDELAAAREIYSKRCINCHGETGEGGAKEFDGKKFKVPNFKDPRVAAEPDAEYIDYIENGDGPMPAFKGKITDDDIKNLVRLIRRDFQGK